MKKIQILSLIVVCLASGCATKEENFTESFRPSVFVTRLPPAYDGMPHGNLYSVVGLEEFKKTIENTFNMQEFKTSSYLGWTGTNSDKPLSPGAARNIAAACGGDKYVAITATTQEGFYNVVNVLASPSRTRELLSIGVLTPPQTLPPAQSKKPRSQTRKPSSNVDLLLNNSTL